jgi:hypothetical protein
MPTGGRDDQLFFKDAINAFKGSETGHGRMQIAGGAPYVRRYRRIASDVLDKLWELWGERDEIQFHAFPLSPSGRVVHADSGYRWGPNIRVNEVHRGNLAITSAMLVHEGCHRVRSVGVLNDLDEEIITRTLQISYYRELRAGIRIHSESRGQIVDLQLNPRDDPADMETMDGHIRRGRLIDWLVRIPEYRRHIDEEWIRERIDWWGGPSNRTPETRRIYIEILARNPSRNAGLIMRLTSDSGPTRAARTASAERLQAPERAGASARARVPGPIGVQPA